MKYILIHIIVIFGSSLALVHSSFAQNSNPEAIAVIVHESIELSEIDIDDLLDIYTLSKQRWDDNTRIRVADYKGSKEIRETFYDALNTTQNNIKKIWLRAQFTGRSIPPKVVDDIEGMIEVVIETPGMVGYVPVSMVPSNAKILLEIDD